VARHAAERRLEAGKAWLHVHDFAAALGRAGMLAAEPRAAAPYPGRSALVSPQGLRELWLQINNACNLACTHCLVSSGPGGLAGLPPETIRRLVDRAAELGLERLYVTGGEPFLRRDLFDLLGHATGDLGLEAIVVTNAIVSAERIRRDLAALDREKVKFQVSLDGARPETNDPIRGAGTFVRALAGAAGLIELGFEVSLTTVTTEHNLDELTQIHRLVRRIGAASQHLMWSHKRGRAVAAEDGFFPESARLLQAVKRVVEAARSEGTVLDNLEAVKRRVCSRLTGLAPVRTLTSENEV
jgi:MoaA/NifB/PqqE/SkfB family radical SAM enzyme